MLHGWTHLPTNLWPDNIPVDHLPWVFRDVANFFPPRESTLRRPCVFVRQVQDELFLTIEHLKVHWLTERRRTLVNRVIEPHPLQIIHCEKGGKGPRYVASFNDRDFAVPSVLVSVTDGVVSAPTSYDGPTRFKLAQKARIPLVLTMVQEQHSENSEYLPERNRCYLRALDPDAIHIQLPVKDRQYRDLEHDYYKGKRWDRILEMAYLRDNEHCISYTPDLSRVPTFFRETDFFAMGNNEAYEVESGSGILEEATEARLDYVIAIYRDTLRIENEFLIYHNQLYDQQRHRANQDLRGLKERRRKLR